MILSCVVVAFAFAKGQAHNPALKWLAVALFMGGLSFWRWQKRDSMKVDPSPNPPDAAPLLGRRKQSIPGLISCGLFCLTVMSSPIATAIAAVVEPVPHSPHSPGNSIFVLLGFLYIVPILYLSGLILAVRGVKTSIATRKTSLLFPVLSLFLHLALAVGAIVWFVIAQRPPSGW